MSFRGKKKIKHTTEHGGVLVLGGGSWGSVLADILARKKLEVSLWEFDERRAALLAKYGKCDDLKDFRLSPAARVSPRLAGLIPAEIVVAAVPSFALESALKKLRGELLENNLPPPRGIILATKGFIGPSARLPSETAESVFPETPVAALTGPSHAEEVARGVPTAVVAACASETFARKTQILFSGPALRVYVNDDIVGCQTAGALKNIYAIAAGIVDGLKLGDNTKAALVTRALNEMSRAGEAAGGKRRTFSGLAGAGDLIVTCYSSHSRNRNLGEILAGGTPLKKALAEMTMVAEGVYAAKAVGRLKKKYRLSMPIADEVRRILFYRRSPAAALRSLMTRPLKSE